MQRFADFVWCRRGRSAIWVDRAFASDAFIDLIADPDRLLHLPDCEIVKDQLKIKVGCVPLELAGRQMRIYVKRYNAFSWRYRIGSLFLASGAFRALRGAQILVNGGFTTARPIAAVETRHWGIVTRSFYLSEEVTGAKISSQFWSDELVPMGGPSGRLRRRDFVFALGQLLAQLHHQNIYHNDLKDFNILAVPKPDAASAELVLLDLEGVRRKRALGWRRRVKNLVQLHRTLGKLLSQTQRMRFAKVYLGKEFGNLKTKKRLLADVIRASQVLDRQKQRLLGANAP